MNPVTDSGKAAQRLPLIAVSSCLLGQRVRYDGQHKFNNVIAEHVAPHARLLPICPESMAGLGIPRPPVQLVQTATGIRALGRDDRRLDVTDKLTNMGDIIARVYPELCGYIVQSRSPSCGFGTTPLLDDEPGTTDPAQQRRTDGLFIARIHQRWPGLPIINESELDAAAAQRFLADVLAYRDLA